MTERQRVDCDSPIELAVVCTRVNRLESPVQRTRRRTELCLRVNPWKRAHTPVGGPKGPHHRNDGERNRKRTAGKGASSVRSRPEAHGRKRNRTENGGWGPLPPGAVVKPESRVRPAR